MNPGFVHLHVHSEYALTDSIIRIPDKPEYGDPATAPRPNLISHARRLGLPALALTDDSNLFALIKFYKAALANGIKPIAGCDIWLRHDGHGEVRRLTLLCQDHAGYLNLSRLISRAWREGQQGGRAIVAEHWLDGASDGLIALAGHASALAQSALADHADSVLLQRLRQRFPERLYLELTRCGRAHEEDWIGAALALGARHDLPLLASNDARFLEREDFEAHEARVCIQQGRVLADPKRPREYSPEQYLKSTRDMRALFADLPEALDNSVELAKRCNLELHFGTYHLPAFPTPPGVTLEQHISASSSTGLTQRLARHGAAGAHTEADYHARLRTELDVIVRMGFAGYFLIVADFINWARRNDIPVGPGRGSGAGSVVAWALGITDLDPLQFGLLFERFLNPERVSMPDFDVDFCMDRRDEVIDYVARTYGRDQVSQIITYGSMAAKAVVRDAGRVLGHGYTFVDSIAKLIPNALGICLADALGESDEAAKKPDLVSAELVQRNRDEDEVRELLRLARTLEDLVRNAGKHAGGVVIAPGPLTDYSPLYAEPGGGGLVTQFDKDDVEAVGLVKFDFLGLRTLTIIDWTVKAINGRRTGSGEAPLDITRLPLDDPAPYELLKHARTVAVFQFESPGMQRMLKEARPDRFEDIIALGALFRPGPMDLIPSFVARKHGREPVTYPDARVEPILRETYGIMVYQEQVMQMAQIVGGYSLGNADLLRRAMGKKNIEQMARERAKFIAGAATHGVEENKADAIFDLMEKFAGYGFNKSHAAAYALVSYQTAWLKAHYPAEFMAATLSSDMEKTDKIVTFLDEARALGLSMLPADVNASAWMFVAVDARSIRHGLGALKGVGRAVSEAIAAEAARQPFRDLGDLCRRVGSTRVNKRVLEALIQSGACDALDADRATLWAQIPDALKAAEQHARAASAGQHGLFGGDDDAPEPLPRPRVPAWTLEQRLNGERAILGFYLSGHPTDAWRSLFAQLVPCALGDIAREWKPPPEARNGRPLDVAWTAAGQVVDVRRRRDDLAIVQLEDASGSLEVIVAQEVLQEAQALLVPGALLVIEGGLRMSDFGLGLRARRVHTLDDICRRRGRLLRVQVQDVRRGFAAALSSALAAWRGGSARVLLTGYRNAQGQADVLLDDTWAVTAHPDLLRALAQMPGVMQCELLLARGIEG
ncbi:MAG: DNA polymerase III subunit alpha [Metallibacterium scheffleri]|jgi:DNA polymerase-3 subunit alpha|uniref:DNA polymerase III subunit alpha n=1 Tax=Metallibacterium scheffleri TaxID=993689 RepID=UPI0026EBC94A|nr:DNA polymerase III subunit alpha [Metallibacterium scheffleri]MCK9368078.1 DNA polymerase III subunit alpha [Metallibacterium scheffleri]